MSTTYDSEDADGRDPRECIRAYAAPKLSSNASARRTLEETLEVAERQFPQYASHFRAVRRELGLRASRVLESSTTTEPRPTTTTAASGVATSAMRSRAPVVRSETADAQLPAYAPEDPDPESTRLLSERLASEAEAAGAVPAVTESATAAPYSDAPPAYSPGSKQSARRAA